MIRMFLRDGLVYGAANALVGMVSLALMPILTRHLGAEGYGALDLCLLIVSTVGLIAAFEIHQGLARFFQDAKSGENRRALCLTALVATLVGGAVGCIAIALFAHPLARVLLGSEDYAATIRLSSQNLLIGSVFTLLHRQLRWSLRPFSYMMVAVIASSVNCLMTLSLIWLWDLGVSAPICGQAAGFLVGGLVALWLVWGDLKGRFEWAWLRTMLSFSGPLVLSGIGMIAMAQIGRYFLGWLVSLEDVGLYSAAMRVAGIAGVLLTGFVSAVTPLIYANYRSESTSRDVVRMLRIYLIMATSLWALLAFLAQDLIGILASAEYARSASVVPALVAAAIWGSLYVFFPGLDLAKRTGLIAVIHLSIGGSFALCNYLLIKWGGVSGAAFGLLLSSMAHGLAYHRLGQRGFAVAVPKSAWMILISLSIISVALAQSSVESIVQQWSFSLRAIIAAGMAVIMVAILGRPLVLSALARGAG